jgi:hypothetical protein
VLVWKNSVLDHMVALDLWRVVHEVIGVMAQQFNDSRSRLGRGLFRLPVHHGHSEAGVFPHQESGADKSIDRSRVAHDPPVHILYLTEFYFLAAREIEHAYKHECLSFL